METVYLFKEQNDISSNGPGVRLGATRGENDKVELILVLAIRQLTNADTIEGNKWSNNVGQFNLRKSYDFHFERLF